MTDLNQSTNPTMNNSESTNTEVVLNNNPNQWETAETTENNLNLSGMFLETPSDNNMDGDKDAVINNTDANTNWEILENSEQNPNQEAPELNTTETSNNLASDNLDPAQEPEAVNNEIILWKFDNSLVDTTEEHDVSHIIEPSLLEHPAILENSPSEEINAEEQQQKAKLAQKEKLLQLIKIHESKAQKSWFTKWILSWVVLTACIVAAWCFFAKDQVVDFLNNLWGEQAPLSANIVNLSENLNEDIENPEVEEFSDEDIENPEVEEFSDEDVENPEVEEFSDEDIENPEVEEFLDEDIENPEVEGNNNLYNITRVNSEEEANWVLPSHCSDLTCYGEDKEFTPCTTFRLSENLDENANRIGKNWVCKYKDPSELVYVEL